MFRIRSPDHEKLTFKTQIKSELKTDLISILAINEFNRLYHLILTNIFCFIHKSFGCKIKHLTVDVNDKVFEIGK